MSETICDEPLREPVEGDWFIEGRRWGSDVHGPITKVTAHQVRYRSPWSSRDQICQRRAVIFTGTEQQCLDLNAALTSLRRDHRVAERKLQEEHLERVDQAIAKAVASSPQNQEPNP